MTRRFAVPEAAEPQTLDEIRDWHGGILDALRDQHTSILKALLSGSAVPPRFIGMTEEEVEEHYDAQRRELDRLTVLNLVASAEATITLDYFRRVSLRVKGRRKDPLAFAYLAWHKGLSKKKKKRPEFDGGILEVLKASGVLDNNMVRQYAACRRSRHWVGHGRHWAKPVEVDRLGPEDVYDPPFGLIRALPG